MSDSKNDNSNSNLKPKRESWAHLREVPGTPKGPQKPWEPEIEAIANEFIGFLKNSDNKKELLDFLTDSFKKFEAQKFEEMKARLENEKNTNGQKVAEFHDPGNITPLLAETFNMHDTERAFVRGLKATKANMVRSVDDRVEEINRLLSGIGGYCSQLRSCFARSTVVFLEQEDPKHSFRERLIFSINLPNYELRHSWTEKENKNEAHEPGVKKASRKKTVTDPGDGRTTLQATWDDAVNALAKIIANTGLKPKYCKNDRHYGRFVMKQDLRSTSELPDEYFSFTLDYNTEEKIKEMCTMYNKIVGDYETRIKKMLKKVSPFLSIDRLSPSQATLKKKYIALLEERDFFVGTVPDPNQLDEGLLFLIEVSTSKDYHIVKDRMQSIMTRYILHLSKIAVQQIHEDVDLEYELQKLETDKKSVAAKKAAHEAEAAEAVAGNIDLGEVQEYVVESGALEPVQKKKAA